MPTPKQMKYLQTLCDCAALTRAQQAALAHHLGTSGLISGLKPPKGTPTADRDKTTWERGQRLLRAMRHYADAGDTKAQSSLELLRADDETADWAGLGEPPDTEGLPWTDHANDLRAQRRSDEEDARRQAWEAAA